MRISDLKNCMEDLKKMTGTALVASAIISLSDGQSLVTVGNNPKGDALVVRMTSFLEQVLEKLGTQMNEYYLIDLEGDYMALIMVINGYCWALAFKKSEYPLGMVLNVAVPELLEKLRVAVS